MDECDLCYEGNCSHECHSKEINKDELKCPNDNDLVTVVECNCVRCIGN